MKKIFLFVSVFLGLVGIFNTTFADTAIHLNIKTPTSTLYDQDITVTPCDSDNAGTMAITAYCAVLQSGLTNNWSWFGSGAFLNSINDIAGHTTKDKDNNDVYHYWSWSLNSIEGATGLNQYELQPNDLISLNFIDPVEPTPDPTPNPAPVEPTIINRSSSGSRRTYTPPPVFSVEKALTYLKSVQGADGSFGDSMLYTDWVAVAFGAMNANDNSGSSREKLLSYFNSHNTINSLLTDNERHSMALLALGQNPYEFNGVNYIKPIVESFDGTQLGDLHLDNDDIFGLIVLSKVGYTKNDEIISKTISLILSAQVSNGSWDNSVDMTAAAIQALEPFKSVSGVSESLSRATNYLASKQNNDGGFGDNSSSVYSTSWAMQAMSTLDASWNKNGKTGIDYLAKEQTNANNNGSVFPASETLANNIWATSYTIATASDKPWSEIMQSVEKPVTIVINPPVIPKPIAKKISVAAPKKKSTVVEKELAPKENVEAINPNALSATAINSVPNQNNSKTLPIVLGSLSGVVLLYALLKKFLIV